MKIFDRIIDFALHPVKNFVPERLNAFPTANAANEGRVIYHNINKSWYGCDGTTWKKLDN